MDKLGARVVYIGKACTVTGYVTHGKDILVPQAVAGLGVQIDEEKLERRTLDHVVLEL